jgi:LysM domain
MALEVLMFKSSIAVLVAVLLGATPASWAQSSKSGTVLELQEGAPDRYTVQRGDTLWDISVKFLKEPWRWPEFWRFNNDQIRNPHEIVPGQVLVLDRFGRNMRVADGSTGPRIRAEPGQTQGISSIPANVIEPWLSRPLVINPGQLDNAPTIVAAEEGRYNLGAGGRAYVKGIAADNKERLWHIYRPGRPLIDPESKESLGVEVVYAGSARLTRVGNPSTIQIATSPIEITPGDRLVPAGEPKLVNYVPHAPSGDVRARVISIYGGRGDAGVLGADFTQSRSDNVADYDSRREAGPRQIIAITKGSRDGLEVGHVLALYRSTTLTFDRSVGDHYMGGPKQGAVELPEERYGLVFIFRTFERVSYGLIVQAQRPVIPGDLARTP